MAPDANAAVFHDFVIIGGVISVIVVGAILAFMIRAQGNNYSNEESEKLLNSPNNNSPTNVPHQASNNTSHTIIMNYPEENNCMLGMNCR